MTYDADDTGDIDPLLAGVYHARALLRRPVGERAPAYSVMPTELDFGSGNGPTQITGRAVRATASAVDTLTETVRLLVLRSTEDAEPAPTPAWVPFVVISSTGSFALSLAVTAWLVFRG